MTTATATNPTTDLVAQSLDSPSLVLFVPNKDGVGNLIINKVLHEEFYVFCEEYFFGMNSIGGSIKPFTHSDCMLDEIRDEEWGAYEYSSDNAYSSWSTPQEWLTKVNQMLGEETIIVCSSYC